MSFAEEIQCKQSHESLISLQDFEIKLLEHIKKCIMQRIKIDRDYSSALFSLASSITKYDTNEFETPFSQVWKAVGREMEILSHLIKDSTDRVCANSLDKIQQLLSEKKVLRKIYVDERNRLDVESQKMNDEINRIAHEYTKSLEKLQKSKQKFDGGRQHLKQEEMKTKMMRQEMQSHLLHNDYVIALKDAALVDKHFTSQLHPALMRFQQNLQTGIVKQSRDILLEFAQLSDATTADFQRINRNMVAHINTIDPIRDHNNFICKHKSDQTRTKNFDFCVATRLPQNEIIANEVTRASLNQKKSDYTGSLAKCQHWLLCKTEELAEVRQSFEESPDLESSGVLSYLVQCRLVESLNRDILEQQCVEERCSAMIAFLSESLMQKQGNHYLSTFQLSELDAPETAVTPNISAGFSVEPIRTAFSGLASALKSTIGKKKSHDVERMIFSFSLQDLPANSFNSSLTGCQRTADDSIQSEETPSVSMRSRNRDVLQQSSSSPSSSMAEPQELQEQSILGSEYSCDLEGEDWYHGILPREEVQKLLQQSGDFLVRTSKNKKTNEAQHVLSVMWNGAHKHFIIQQNEEGEYKFEGPAFQTIPGLIWFHFNGSQTVTKKSEVILKRAVPREIWELRNDDIVLKEKIGSGQFGEVYRGVFKKTGQEVGIKTCRETITEVEKLKFLHEGRILKQYDHPNIVKFIGIAVHRHPVMIVMEFVPGGSLVTFLRSRGSLETTSSLVKMCEDIASGMAYLESKSCLHRDLAARNCLVGEMNVVKISDFGMSREEREYVISDGPKQIPVKWTAPEALNYGLYTWSCDVWSYGILVWEIFSEGGNPYPGMSNSDAKAQVDAGYRMAQPPRCPKEIYDLMLTCWSQVPTDRPHFYQIHQCLTGIGESLA